MMTSDMCRWVKLLSRCVALCMALTVALSWLSHARKIHIPAARSSARGHRHRFVKKVKMTLMPERENRTTGPLALHPTAHRTRRSLHARLRAGAATRLKTSAVYTPESQRRDQHVSGRKVGHVKTRHVPPIHDQPWQILSRRHSQGAISSEAAGQVKVASRKSFGVMALTKLLVRDAHSTQAHRSTMRKRLNMHML